MKTKRFINSKLTLLLFALTIVVGVLSGCVGVMLGGAAGGASVINDPRTAGSQVEDESIELKAGNALHGQKDLRGRLKLK